MIPIWQCLEIVNCIWFRICQKSILWPHWLFFFSKVAWVCSNALQLKNSCLASILGKRWPIGQPSIQRFWRLFGFKRPQTMLLHHKGQLFSFWWMLTRKMMSQLRTRYVVAPSSLGIFLKTKTSKSYETEAPCSILTTQNEGLPIHTSSSLW